MKELQFEPVGKVKEGRIQKMNRKMSDLTKVYRAISVSMFLLGIMSGIFIGITL